MSIKVQFQEEVDHDYDLLQDILLIEDTLKEYRDKYRIEYQKKIYPIYKDTGIYLAPNVEKALLFFVTGTTNPKDFWIGRNADSLGPERLLKDSWLKPLINNNEPNLDFEIDETRLIWHHRDKFGKVISSELYIFPDKESKDQILEAYEKLLNEKRDQKLGEVYKGLVQIKEGDLLKSVQIGTKPSDNGIKTNLRTTIRPLKGILKGKNSNESSDSFSKNLSFRTEVPKLSNENLKDSNPCNDRSKSPRTIITRQPRVTTSISRSARIIPQRTPVRHVFRTTASN